MNRIYRLVFNRELGLVQVASELTSSARGGAGSAKGVRTATLPVLRFAMYVALGFVMALPAFAQAVDGRIIGDQNAPGAQRPTVLDAGNGVPVVSIATPSRQGVSRNTYSQFDVGQRGAVLNNSRIGAATQLGGGINGNANLARGTARIILNEVNGPASQLNGYVEVGGDRAQVVIANPAGIRANGGGFLNASRVTLTTGTPILNGGSLDGYRVEGGAIQVDGIGLDTSRSDYTYLIARSMQLNAGVWAQQLQTTLGANAVSVNPAQVTKIERVAGPVPQFALDASALGGMYANKIVLLGTEHGVGVRNAGTIGAQAGDLVVTVDGRLDNTGMLQSKANTHLGARGDVANAGTLSAVRELIVTTPANINSSGGTFNAQRIQIDAVALRNHGGSIQQTGSQALALQSGTLSNRDGGRIGMVAPGSGTSTGNPGTSGGNAGGTDPNSGSGSGGQDGRASAGGGTLPLSEPLSDGVLRIAGALDNDGGVINAGGGVSVATDNGLDNSGGRLGLRDLALAKGNLGNAGGELKVAGNANLHVDQINNDVGRFDIAGALQVNAQTLSNRRGAITQGGTGASSIRLADSFDNTDGTFATNASALTLGIGVLVNERGRIEHAGAHGLTLQAGMLHGAVGKVVTAGAATLRADAVDHRGATLGAAQITLDAHAVDNRGGRMAASGPNVNALTVRDTLDNGSGTIVSQGDLVIRAATLGNTGGTVQQAGTGTLSIDATTLNGAGGTLGSNGAISITGITTDLRRGTTAARSITVDTGTLVTAGGTLTASGTNALAITARNRLDNTAGKIASNGALQLNAGALANADGTIGAAGKGATELQVAGALDNTRGTIAAAGATSIHAGGLKNVGGKLQSGGEGGMSITADDSLVNDGGTIEANGAIALTAQSMTNAGGTVRTQQAITTTVVDTLDNSGGTVAAGGDLSITAGTLSNHGTFDPAIIIPSAQKGLFGDRVSLTADAIDNTRGQIYAADALTVRGRSGAGTALTNARGAIDGTGAVSVTATLIDNAGGTLVQRGGDGALVVMADGALSNTIGGLIGAEGSADVHAGTLDNTGGTVSATGDLTVASDGDTLNRSGGLLQSNGDLTVSAGGSFDNTDGVFDADGRGALTAAVRIDNTRGQVLAGGGTDRAALTVGTSSLMNLGGTVGTRDGDLALDVVTVDNAGDGRLVAQRDITFNTSTVINAGGTVFATRNLAYENAAATLDNAGGQFGAGDTARLALANMGNTAGGRIQAGTVWLTTPNLDISGGEVAANALHANLVTLTGLGRLYGAQWLDVDVSGDFTYENGQRLESDVLLDLAVAGTFTNRGTLQAPGELALTAANLVNTSGAVINASNAGGTGVARITIDGTVDNQRGASLEGDSLTLSARDVTNTGDIVGDTVGMEADTLTNGRELLNQKAAVDYGEGFIGAAEVLDLRIGQRLSNLDGDIFSAGDLTIAGRTSGSRVGTLENFSGRIQAEGDATIAAEYLNNSRRMIGVETYMLSPDEQYALSSQRQFDEAIAALSDAERQRLQYLNSRGAGLLSAAEIAEKKALNHKVGWQTIDHVSDAMLAAINTWYRTIGAPGYGASDGYVIDDAATVADNPGAEVIQRDTYSTGERLVESLTSAAGQIVAGGDLTIDAGQRVRNHASQIAAGRNLAISGQNYNGTTNASDAKVENIAVAGQLTGEREIQAWVYPEIPAMYKNGSGWHQTVAELQGFMHETITAAGPTVASASITAGRDLTITGGDVTNTSVGVGGGLEDLNGGGGLNGPGSVGLGAATGGHAGAGPRGPGAAGTQVVGTPDRPLPGLVPADNGMFDLRADPNSPFLVTTAPRFAKGDGTGSDYLLQRLGWTTDLHKRLGDGYYEQRLVMDQILQLTGRRSLNGNGDATAQYRDLMEGAAAEAARLGLPLGAPLTSTQIASLSQDIVWLVEQEVNGQKVLVPVVYLSKVTTDRMGVAGALMAADTVDIQSSGTVRNDGTFASERGTWLIADRLINEGAIRSGGRVDIATRMDTTNRGILAGHTVLVDAEGDFVNTVRFDGINATGGVVNAGAGGLQVSAARDVVNQGTMNSAGHAIVSGGRDFVQNAATSNTAAGSVKAPAGSITSTGSTVVNSGRDAILDQSSITAGQHAVIDAGRDAKFIASDVKAEGSIAVTAGRDIVSETVTDSITIIAQESTKQGKTRTKTTATTTDQAVTGSTFQAGGDVAMVADRDVTLTAATVHSGQGDIAMAAKRDVNLLAAAETDSVVQNSVSKKKGTLSSTKATTHSEVIDTYAIGTTLSGERVSVAAGRDVTTQAADVVAAGDVTMAAGRNLTIGTAETEHRESFNQSKKKSGVFSNGGFSITAGTSKVEQGYTQTESGHQGSVIGSVDGKIALTAGETVHITGSDVLSNTGTAIVGKNVVIDAAVNATQASQTYKEKSAGIHLGLTGGAVTAAETAYGKGKAAGEVKDDRLKALYGAQAAMAAKDAYDGAQAMANGASAADAGISLRIGIGASSASATSTTTDDAARGSTIHSNGNVIVATDGNLDVIGSQVEGNSVGLAATGNINLKSQAEQQRSESHNKNGSAEVGFSIGSTTGFYVTANAGKGKGGGNGITHAETTIKGREGVTFVSGGSTTLEGAQIIAERVAGNVGGDFNVISQQDTDDYASKQQQAGGTFVYGYGGSAYYGQQKAESHFASVQEQSGIQAGQGGFQIDVEGSTHLKGGAIASTADASMNRLSTGSLTVEDIANNASAKASGVNLGADSSMFSDSKYAAAVGIAGNLFGSGDDAGHRGSKTHADIAEGTVVVGNGDSLALAALSRTATALDGIGAAPLDLQELQDHVVWEQAVKGEVFQQAVKFTDESYRTMFLKEAKIYVVEEGSEGKPLPPRELTLEEKFNLKPAADGKIHIAENGINNDLDGASKYAQQHSTADGPQYFIHFPKAENGLSELLIAAYQRYLESDALGLANATDLTREYMLLYGQEGLHLDGHSRGSLTVGNAMESLENLPGSSGLLSGTTIGFIGPAYNAAAADALLSHLQGRSEWANPQGGVLTLQNHKNDIVGGWIGLNPSTGGVTPKDGNTAWEMARVLGGKDTPHSCYGSAPIACERLWSGSPDNQSTPIPINQVQMSRAEEIMYRLEVWRGSLK